MSTKATHVKNDGDTLEITTRRLQITTMTDGDPFDPKYATTFADSALTLERTKELAFELYGERHTTVMEVVETRRTRRIGS